MAKKREGIPKSVRFEVFKRDSFKCQYCGNSAPEVLLEIDHITPVAEDGGNDILNLITACKDCNSGKSDRKLSDKSVIAKSRSQMEELQERREQLEMLIEWRQGLRNLDDETLDRLTEYWHDHAPGWTFNENGRKKLQKLVRQFSVDEVLAAMDIAAENYIRKDNEGKVSAENWELAWSKVGGICKIRKDELTNPDVKRLYYIRGIARNRCGWFDDNRAIAYLKKAHRLGASVDRLEEVALECSSWSNFRDDLELLIEKLEQE